jgi:hypothetical protein
MDKTQKQDETSRLYKAVFGEDYRLVAERCDHTQVTLRTFPSTMNLEEVKAIVSDLVAIWDAEWDVCDGDAVFKSAILPDLHEGNEVVLYDTEGNAYLYITDNEWEVL